MGRTSHCAPVDEEPHVARNNPVDIDGDDETEEVRTEARLIWKPEEDGRVVFP
jgi:hypothetical protein